MSEDNTTPSQPRKRGGDDVVEEAALEAEHRVATDMAQYMSQFARSFEASSRRWELVVYPSMLAFIIRRSISAVRVTAVGSPAALFDSAQPGGKVEGWKVCRILAMALSDQAMLLF